MTNFKRITILLFMLIFGTVACSKKSRKRAPIRGASQNRVSTNPNLGPGFGLPGGGTSNVFSSEWPGQFISDNTLQTGLYGYVGVNGADANSLIGSVTAPGTGVFFKGRVAVSGSQVFGGFIEIMVWDSIALSNGGYGLVLPTLTVNSSASTISGNQYQVVAQDDFGQVVFQGSLNNGQMFVGTAHYQNSDGSQGTLGSFQIPACSFFICQ
ncbi:MAG: hypothetical protein D6797_05325 [Bdellovibrio sp.]|nr:MAG: hypothetical protein D6797_05325 [Bdellovibrio sp.]